MCVFLQNGKWWYEFTVCGKRIRKSSRSTDKDVAKLVESEHRRSLERGMGGVSPTLEAIKAKEKEQPLKLISLDSPEAGGPSSAPQADPMVAMSLREAGELWLKSQQERRREKTIECNEGHLRALLNHFGDIPLSTFHIGHFEQYQKIRGKNCSPSTVNHELNTLSRILRQVDLWHPIKRRYNPLVEREWKAPKIFTADEQERLFKKLKGNPNLELGDIVFTITRNTTASGCELRGLRLRNLELAADPPRIHIPPDSTKNTIRPRTIPLNESALNAFKRAVERAAKLGCHYPEHYLFPYRVNRSLYDPRKPASATWLRKQVEHLRKITGIEHINPHVFRHLAVTELLEKGAPEQTVIALAGWVGRKMIETYSHARIEAKADVVKLLDQTEHKVSARPAKAPTQKPDIMHPAIQAEIARQVALALQHQQSYVALPESAPAPNGPRLIKFPSAGSVRANGGSL